MGDNDSVARPNLQRIAVLRDSLIDCDAVADDVRGELLEVVARYEAALQQRDAVADRLAAAIREATA